MTKARFLFSICLALISLQLFAQDPFQCEDGKFGYKNVDLGDDLTIPCQYDSASGFYNERAVVGKEGKQFMIDATGKEVSARYDYINDMMIAEFPGWIPVKNNGKHNLIDLDGKELLPGWMDTINTDAWSLDDFEYAPIQQNGKWNMLSKERKFLSEDWFDTIISHESMDEFGKSIVKNDGKYNVITKKEKILKAWL